MNKLYIKASNPTSDFPIGYTVCSANSSQMLSAGFILLEELSKSTFKDDHPDLFDRLYNTNTTLIKNRVILPKIKK
jgi:hypothetical protein